MNATNNHKRPWWGVLIPVLVLIVVVLVAASARAAKKLPWAPAETEGRVVAWAVEQALFVGRTMQQSGLSCAYYLRRLVPEDFAYEYCRYLEDVLPENSTRLAADYRSPLFRRWVKAWHQERVKQGIAFAEDVVPPPPPTAPQVHHPFTSDEALMDAAFVVNFLHGHLLAVRAVDARRVPSKFDTCEEGAVLQVGPVWDNPDLSLAQKQKLAPVLKEFYQQSCLLGRDLKLSRREAYARVRPYWQRAVEAFRAVDTEP